MLSWPWPRWRGSGQMLGAAMAWISLLSIYFLVMELLIGALLFSFPRWGWWSLCWDFGFLLHQPSSSPYFCSLSSLDFLFFTCISFLSSCFSFLLSLFRHCLLYCWCWVFTHFSCFCLRLDRPFSHRLLLWFLLFFYWVGLGKSIILLSKNSHIKTGTTLKCFGQFPG